MCMPHTLCVRSAVRLDLRLPFGVVDVTKDPRSDALVRLRGALRTAIELRFPSCSVRVRLEKVEHVVASDVQGANGEPFVEPVRTVAVGVGPDAGNPVGG